MTDHKNPMHSRCGLEDCDCGYVIEKLMEELNPTDIGRYYREKAEETQMHPDSWITEARCAFGAGEISHVHATAMTLAARDYALGRLIVETVTLK